MKVVAETLNYEAEGLNMVACYYVDVSSAKPRPGILVFPDARGLDDHAKTSAQRLARLGYAALACDVLGDGRYFEKTEEAVKVARELAQTPTRLRTRGKAALDALASRSEVNREKIAAIGYCFGGNMAVELARSGAPIAAAVGLHGGVVPPSLEDTKKIRGKVLICTGSEDPYIPQDQRAAFEKDMRESGIDWRMHIYGRVYHSFTNPEADRRGMPHTVRYDAGADARSWAEMLALFNEVFI